VVTQSGSKYFLSGGDSPTKASADAKAAADARAKARQEAAEAKKTAQEEARRAAEARKQAQLEARQAALAEKQRIAEEKMQAQLEAKKKAEAAKAEREAKSKQSSPKAEVAAVAPVKGRPTISLFGLGGGNDKVAPTGPPAPKVTKQQPPVAEKKQAPKGVPTLSGWRLNGDGSISGNISGSPNFRDGEPSQLVKYPMEELSQEVL